MSQYYLIQDTRKCIGCRCCEVQCKANNNLPAGPRVCQIIEVVPKAVGDLPRCAFIFMPCYHCENPLCVAACPTDAMLKRENDGIIYVDHDSCVGCKTCISACPWNAPQWNAESGVVVKCDYCKERVDAGLKPACVTTCTTQCLEFGQAQDMPNIRRRRHAFATGSLVHSSF